MRATERSTPSTAANTSSSLRVLQAANWYAPAYAFGGPSRLLEAYATMLRARGVTVDVLTTDMLSRTSFMGPHSNDAGPFGRVRYLKACRLTGLNKRNLHLHYRLYAAVLKEARRYDCVQFADYRGALALLLLLLGRFGGVRLAHHSFGMISQRQVGKKVIWDLLFKRLFARSVSVCFAENETERQEYLAIGFDARRIFVLPHPVDPPDRYRVGPADDGAAASDGVDPSRPLRLCFVGRLHPTKGIPRVIELLHGLKAHAPDATLTIMGDDDGALPDIRAAIAAFGLESSVVLRAAAYDDSRFDLYAQSDAFVILAADNLQTSLASVEALATGTPVISNQNCRIEGLEDHVLYVDNLSPAEVMQWLAARRGIPRHSVALAAQQIFSTENVTRILHDALVSTR